MSTFANYLSLSQCVIFSYDWYVVIDIDPVFLLIYTEILKDMFVAYIHSENRVQMKKRLRKHFFSEMVSALGKQLDSIGQFFIVPITLFSDGQKIGENATVLLKDLNQTRQYMETNS